MPTHIFGRESPYAGIYRLDPIPLGEGGTATVWCGRQEDALGAQPIAVKIAHPSSTPSEIEAFWAEYDILRELGSTNAKRCVPTAGRGFDPTKPDVPIILMELVPDDWQLTLTSQATGGRLLETLAVETAVQYADLLVAAHAIQITSRGDRKARDLRCDRTASPPRLIVLDWNRAQKIPLGAPSSLQQELVCQDVRGFAKLWSELVLGFRLDALPALDSADLVEWSDLTRGLRTILTRAWHAGNIGGYSDAHVLRSALVAHRTQLERLERRDAKFFLEQASIKIEKADSNLRADVADDLFTLLDFAVRSNGAIAHDPQFIEIEKWAQSKASKHLQHANRTLEAVREKIGQGYYEEAIEQIAEAIGKLGQVDRASLGIFQQLLRWTWIAHAGAKGNELRVDMQEAIQQLAECVAKVETLAAQKEDSFFELYSVKQIFEQSTAKMLPEIRYEIRPLELELEIRQQLAAIVIVKEDPTQLYGALQDIQLSNAWQELGVREALFAKGLESTLPMLEDRLYVANVAKLDQAPHELFAANFERIRALLQPDHVVQIPWRDFSTEIQSARENFRALVLLPSGVNNTERATYDFVCWLDKINSLMVRQDTLAALRLAQNPLATFISNSSCFEVEKHCARIAITELQTLLEPDYGWRWPDELRRAQSLRECLERTAEQFPDSMTELKNLSLTLEAWDSDLRKLREALGFSEGDNDYTRLLLDPASESLIENEIQENQIDALLQSDAEYQKIEVFDRTVLSDKSLDCRVESILAARHMARLAKRTQILFQDIRRLGQDIDLVMQALPEYETRLQQSLSTVTDAMGKFKQFSDMSHTTEFAVAIVQAEELAQRFLPLVAQLQQIQNTIPDLRQIIDQINFTQKEMEQSNLNPATLKQELMEMLDLAASSKKAREVGYKILADAQHIKMTLVPLLQDLKNLTNPDVQKELEQLHEPESYLNLKINQLVDALLQDRMLALPAEPAPLDSLRRQLDQLETRDRQERIKFKKNLEFLVNEWNDIAGRIINTNTNGIKLPTDMLHFELELLINLTVAQTASPPFWARQEDWSDLRTVLGRTHTALLSLGNDFARFRLWINRLDSRIVGMH